MVVPNLLENTYWCVCYTTEQNLIGKFGKFHYLNALTMAETMSERFRHMNFWLEAWSEDVRTEIPPMFLEEEELTE